MLKKVNRVDRKTINYIFKTGRTISVPSLIFKFVVNKNSINKGISFTAPKSVAKSAVKRNLLRRRGYLALKNLLPLFPVGVQGLFIFSKNSMELFGGKVASIYKPVENIENEIKKIISKLN